MAISTASNWTWNFLIAFFTPFITSAIDFRYGYVFAGTNFLGGLIVFFFVIEGQGRTLEEIDTMYIEHVNPMKSSKWIPPSAEEMARIRRQAGTEVTPGLNDEEKLSGETERGARDAEFKAEERHAEHVA
uniref:Major facilitator superfamily (MFS) profile domain-containing protein n=1 Tax=Araucaria cunninghamii TaxID=56994 RepID=A0A0D6R281_ARACU